MNGSRAFTLLEVFIVVSIGVVLVGIITQSFFRFRDISILNTTADDVASLLNEARTATLSSRGDTMYGVRIEQARAVFFKGGTFVEGASTNKVVRFDRRLTATTTVSGGNIIFARLTGTTNNSGTTTIALVSGATRYRTIFVGTGGSIEKN